MIVHGDLCIALLAYFTYFQKTEAGLWDHQAVGGSVNTPINFWMPEPIFIKLGTYVMVPEPISAAYFINPFH
jgi:hypothetical protein